MPSPDEKILVCQLKQGNDEAFKQLFLKYHKKLYHFSKKILKDRDESEGIVQNVFMEIWETRKRLDEEKSFSGYLFKIAKNKIYNTIRKKINEQVYREYIVSENHGNGPSVEDEYNSRHLSITIEKLIDSLPRRRKEVFLLSRDEGLTYKEIATKLKISENTVDTQIRSALNFLRNQFRKLV